MRTQLVFIILLISHTAYSQNSKFYETNKYYQTAYYDSALHILNKISLDSKTKNEIKNYFEAEIAIAECWSKKRDYVKAIEFTNNVLQENNKAKKPIKEIELLCYKHLASFHLQANNLAKANEYINKLFDHKKLTTILNDCELSEIFLIYGEILESSNQNEKALEAYKKSIILSDNCNQKIKIHKTKALNLIGNLFYHNNQLDSAVKIAKISIQINMDEIIPYTELIVAYNNLSHYYIIQNSDNLAKQNGLMCRMITKSHINKYSFEISEMYYLLGLCSFNLSEIDDAEIFIEQSLQLKNYLYQNKPKDEIADCYLMLGKVADLKNQLQKAVDHKLKAISIFEENRSINKAAESYYALAETYLQSGDIVLSVKNLHKARELYISELKMETQKSIQCLVRLGDNYYTLNQSDSALIWYNKALIKFIELPEKTILLANLYNKIGDLQLDNNQIDNAISTFTKAISIFTDIYGFDSEIVADNYKIYGNKFLERNEKNTAIQYYQISLEIFLKIYGEKHPQVLYLRELLNEKLK